MSEAVTVPSLVMITSIASEESLVRSDRHTDRLRVIYVKICNDVLGILKKKKKKDFIWQLLSTWQTKRRQNKKL